MCDTVCREEARIGAAIGWDQPSTVLRDRISSAWSATEPRASRRIGKTPVLRGVPRNRTAREPQDWKDACPSRSAAQQNRARFAGLESRLSFEECVLRGMPRNRTARDSQDWRVACPSTRLPELHISPHTRVRCYGFSVLTRAPALKLMLLTLALSTLLSIYSIFDGSGMGWTVVGTSSTIAVALAITLPAMPTDARTALSLLQRTHLGYVACLTALIIAGIWTNENVVWHALVCWLVVGLPCFVVALLALKHRQEADRSLAVAERWSIWGPYVALGSSLLWVLVSPNRWNEEELIVGYSILAASSLAAAAAIALRAPSTNRVAARPTATRFDRLLGLVGIVAAVAGGSAVIASRLTRSSGGTGSVEFDLIAGAVVSAATVAIPIGIWNLLGLARTQPPWSYLRHVAAAASSFSAVLWNLVWWRGFGAQFGFLEELLAATLVLTASSFLGAIILMRIHRAHRADASPIDRLDLRCPRCAQRSTVGLGESRCTSCGLSVFIDVRDDQCPACGYDLQGMPAGSLQCPECGRVRQQLAAARVL